VGRRAADATLGELRGRLRDDLGLVVSVGTVWNGLRALRLSYKKSR
jgi:transposase